ncbi:MAG: VOC family protein [Thaumarchaeota archaeon]|nr:VOC family protein [Nitrososphaerota archaeon]
MLSQSNFAAIIPIKNMDRAIKFYTDKLGGKLNMRGEGDMKDSWASVTLSKTEFWLLEPEKREKIELAYNAFIVKDIKETVGELREKGVRFLPAEKMGPDTKIDGPIAYMPWGAKSAFFKDSEGNLLMLWENAE